MELGLNFEHNLRFKGSIGKYVKVKTVGSYEYEGWLKCIDPMSGNCFLIGYDDNFTSVREIILIMGDGCTNLDVVKEPDDKVKDLLENLIRKNKVSHEDVSERKNRLLAWIKKNRLPVFENEDHTLIVAGNVSVASPYDIQSCSSVNPRTLKSIRQLVAKMPSDIDQDAHKKN